jgi:hypothetical protein
MAVSTIDALYNGTSEKLTTTGTGITVTGTVAATAYTGDGSALTGTGSPSIDDNGNATAITIDSSENVGIGTTSPSSYYANHLVVDTGSSAQSGITIVSDTGNQGMFAFADGTSGDERYRGAIDYNHSNDSMAFLAAGGERLRIDSDGLKFNGDTAAANALDDYEEGTWSPSSVGVSIGVNGNKATYTKIGNTVIASAELNVASNSNNAQLRVTLPFTVGLVSDGGLIRYSNAGSNAPTYVVSNDNNADVVFYTLAGGAATFADVSNKRVDFLIIYRV